MAYLDTYFNGSYNDYLTYFGDEYKNTFYKYVFKNNPPAEGVENGGGTDQYDWINDTNGLAQNWYIAYIVSQQTEIVTGNNFTGNAQRFETTDDISDLHATLYAILGEMDPNYRYHVRFRYRTNSYLSSIKLGSEDEITLPYNDGNAEVYLSEAIEIDNTIEVLYFKINQAGVYFEIDEVELIKESETYLVKENPAGWEKLQIKWERSKKYNSILRNYAVSLRWYIRNYGGGDFIKDQYDLYDILAEITVEIYEINTQTGDYVKFYDGILNFTPGKVKFLITDRFVEIGIKDGTKEAKLIDRSEVEYDLFTNISHDGKQLTPIAEQIIKVDPLDLYLRFETKMRIRDHLYNIIWSNNDTPVEWYPTLEETTINDIGDRIVGNGDDGVIYENTTDYDTIFRITNIDVQQFNSLYLIPSIFGNSAFVSISYIVYVYDADDIPVQIINIDNYSNTFSQSGGTTQIINPEFDLSNMLYDWEVPAGGYIKFYVIYLITDIIGYKISYSNNVLFNLNGYEIFPSVEQTNTRGLFLHEAFGKVLQLATSEQDTDKVIYSTLLGHIESDYETYLVNGKWANLFLTSGFNLRQFPDKGILASIDGLFNSLFAIEPVGLGYDRVNDRFFIETMSEFFKDNYFMFDLGEVNNFESEPYPDAYIPSIKCGWPEVDFEDLNGVSEFNMPLEYTINQPVKNEVNWRADYHGASIAIDLCRRKQYSTNSTEDTKYDEFRYIIDTDRIRAIQGKSGDSELSGIVNIDQYFNLRITGRENVLRHKSMLTPMLWKHPQDIRFLSLKKGVSIIYTNQAGKIVNEIDNIKYDELSGKYYIPVLDTFEKEINQEIFNTMNSDPHGFIRYTHDEEEYNGFIKSLNVESYPLKATWEVIRREYVESLNYVYEDSDNYTFEDENNYTFE